MEQNFRGPIRLLPHGQRCCRAHPFRLVPRSDPDSPWHRRILGLPPAALRVYDSVMQITLNLDEKALAALPLAPGERERLMEIELACRFYANGWLTLGQAAAMAQLDRYAFGAALGERGIPRDYGPSDLVDDLQYAGRQ